MSKIFATSDLHFGHHNIIRYCSRPFKKTAEMNESLIERWNSRVSEADLVYFLGDFAMGPGVNAEFIVGTLASLNGQIKVVLGNHDQPNKKHKQLGLKRIVEDHIEYEDEDFPIEILPDIFELSFEGTNFVMCHYPMNDWNGKFHGSVHLHGHQHSGFSSAKAREMKGKKRYDVGVDMYGGPVEITGDLRYLNDPKGWE